MLSVMLAATCIGGLFTACPGSSLDEWKGIVRPETLDVFLKDRLVGTLFHSFAFVDSSCSGLREESSMSVPGPGARDSGAGGMAIDLLERRTYDTAGALRSAYQRLSGESGVNEWVLDKSTKGWRLTITAGGLASSVTILAVKENILPTLRLLKSVRTSKCRSGDVFCDTAFDLVTQKTIVTTCRCTAVSPDRKRWTFDLVDDLAGRSQKWVLDDNALTRSQEIEGMFVARKRVNGPPQAHAGSVAASADLTELFSIKKERPPNSGERIAVVVPAGMSLDSSVSQFYVKRGDSLLCADFPDQCGPLAGSGTAPKRDSSYEAWTRPTVTLQSDYPAIVSLAARLKANRKGRCAIIDTCTRYVYASLAKRNTATFSNAVETLKAGFGDCGEHAVLLAAVLRAAKVPARVVLGLLYFAPKNAFVGHAWVMAYAGGGTWVFCDPAFGIFPAAHDRVPLIVDDNGARALLLARYIGRIGIAYVPR
jgi:hypothetical protein